MKTLTLNNVQKIAKNKALLERKLNIKITINKSNVTIDGKATDEYEAEKVLAAISFGYTAYQAIDLIDPEFEFRKLNIKSYTRRKNLTEVKARIIGTKGKTKRVLEDISECSIIIHDNTVGILGPSEFVEITTLAVGNLIKGTKQGNVYRYIEKMKKSLKESNESLGLR